MLHMLQVFQINIASVCSKYFICFGHMFASIFNLDVAYVVLFGCCICLQWFSSVFLMFFSSVSEACFKCFICLLLYVASIASGCFKSR